jgi:hypothetical protein
MLQRFPGRGSVGEGGNFLTITKLFCHAAQNFSENISERLELSFQK